jgi:4-hydroxybenzoate polyprenyltransferase
MGMSASAPYRSPDPSARLLARGVALPLVRRVQVGEGVLLAINVSLSLALRLPALSAVLLALHSTVLLVQMYALNDWWDAARDLNNPRKDQLLASDLHTHRTLFARALGIGHVASVGWAFALLGWRCGLVTAGVLAVNAVYSFWLKGLPILDVIIVGLWGALFAALVGPVRVVLPVGVMTAASHVFQAMGDRSVDLRAGITTTAASQRLALWVLAGCCVVLVLSTWAIVGFPLALAGLVPWIAALALRQSLAAWLASKLAFGVAWLGVLWVIYGHR